MSIVAEPSTPSTSFKPKKSVALSGVTAGNTALCTVGKTGNDLHYRGYDILDIAEVCEFEEIAHLLVHGKLPTRAELKAYKTKLKALRGLPTWAPNVRRCRAARQRDACSCAKTGRTTDRWGSGVRYFTHRGRCAGGAATGTIRYGDRIISSRRDSDALCSRTIAPNIIGSTAAGEHRAVASAEAQGTTDRWGGRWCVDRHHFVRTGCAATSSVRYRDREGPRCGN